MKTIFFGIFVFFLRVYVAQTIYSTSFNAGHGWTLNTFNNLNTNSANEGTLPNIWYVSDMESNKGVGNRGGANCGNVTLHIGSTSIGDAGASYDAGGCTNLGFGPCSMCVTNGLYCVVSDRSAESPLISTLTNTALTLSFVYIHWGTGLLDNAEIIYSVNGGVTWIKLADVPKSGCCNGASSCLAGCTNNASCTGTHQGKWQLYSAAMPAAALGISNLKLGFRWFNDDISTNSSDPSIGVDDVMLVNPVLPIDLVDFNVESNADNIKLKWSSIDHKNFKGFVIERSLDGISFTGISEVKPAMSESHAQLDYYFTDHEVQGNQVYYYRLRCVDKDETFRFSDVKTARIWMRAGQAIIWHREGENILFNSPLEFNFEKATIMDVTGKPLICQEMDGSKGSGIINVSGLVPGIYFLQLGNLKENRTTKIVVD